MAPELLAHSGDNAATKKCKCNAIFSHPHPLVSVNQGEASIEAIPFCPEPALPGHIGAAAATP
jgi:hypothetical protein